MSKKGQHNISGIDFQLRVALLYLLESFNNVNFIKAKFEGDNLSDFTLFFKDSNENRSFIHNIETKKWSSDLKQNEIRKLIKEEIHKRNELYSTHNDKFFIIALNFSKNLKNYIKEIKKHIPLREGMEEEDFKKIYQPYLKIKGFTEKKKPENSNRNSRYQKNLILERWRKEEILFLRFVELVELKEDQINNGILKHFCDKDTFYYRESDLKNIQNLLFEKIKEKSKAGDCFDTEEVKEIIDNFRIEETNKSESYNLQKSLGDVAENIESFFETEEKFKKLNNDSLYLTPISERRNAVFSIVKKLKESNFKLESIKFFIDKILIKNYYFHSCMELLEEYIKDEEKYKDILCIISKLAERNIQFDYYCHEIFEFLYKMLDLHPVDEVKGFTIKLLDESLPDFNTNDIPFTFSYRGFRYKSVPKLINILFKNNNNNKKEYIDFIFKKIQLC